MIGKRPETPDFNPRLRATFLQIVQNQLTKNDPPETKQTYDRLIAQGISAADAKVFIAQAVCVEVWHCQHNHTPFNLERFIKNLTLLPKKPEQFGQ